MEKKIVEINEFDPSLIRLVPKNGGNQVEIGYVTTPLSPEEEGPEKYTQLYFQVPEMNIRFTQQEKEKKVSQRSAKDNFTLEIPLK